MGYRQCVGDFNNISYRRDNITPLRLMKTYQASDLPKHHVNIDATMSMRTRGIDMLFDTKSYAFISKMRCLGVVRDIAHTMRLEARIFRSAPRFPLARAPPAY